MIASTKETIYYWKSTYCNDLIWKTETEAPNQLDCGFFSVLKSPHYVKAWTNARILLPQKFKTLARTALIA